MFFYFQAHLLIYNALPFSVMLICNSLIIYNIKFGSKIQSKNKSSAKRKRRMTIMLVLVTFTFMMLTLPSVIVHTFLRNLLSNKPYRRLVNLTVNNLLHTSHAINFLLYVFSAPNFRIEIVSVLSSVFGVSLGGSGEAASRANGTMRCDTNGSTTMTPVSKRKPPRMNHAAGALENIKTNSSFLISTNNNQKEAAETGENQRIRGNSPKVVVIVDDRDEDESGESDQVNRSLSPSKRRALTANITHDSSFDDPAGERLLETSFKK
jgi:hypothetical protein